MNIPEVTQKIKNFAEDAIHEWGLVAIVFLVALGSFGLGRLSMLEDAQPAVAVHQALDATAKPLPIGGFVVAARGGSAYYFPWCSGAGKIALQNQVWFADEKAAKKAGYTPAKACKGLE